MITKPSPAALMALTTLRGHTGWAEVIKFFDGELVALSRALSEAQEDWRLRQLQGRAQFIRELLALVQNAPTMVGKLGGSSL